jgi:formylmethanofuran dehydrogenase subunit B
MEETLNGIGDTWMYVHKRVARNSNLQSHLCSVGSCLSIGKLLKNLRILLNISENYNLYLYFKILLMVLWYNVLGFGSCSTERIDIIIITN